MIAENVICIDETLYLDKEEIASIGTSNEYLEKYTKLRRIPNMIKSYFGTLEYTFIIYNSYRRNTEKKEGEYCEFSVLYKKPEDHKSTKECIFCFTRDDMKYVKLKIAEMRKALGLYITIEIFKSQVTIKSQNPSMYLIEIDFMPDKMSPLISLIVKI